MKYLLMGAALLLAANTAVPVAYGQVSIGIGLPQINIALPSVSIGIHVPTFPTFAVVPGFPVYYAPRLGVNLFFFDGLYWVFQDDRWYASTWYDGPWAYYEPQFVPDFILRVPVRFYVAPPVYFSAWAPFGPPRWGERWGGGWERDRLGWDQWDRRQTFVPAPLPLYQRQYSGSRYPGVEQQAIIHNQSYNYRPQNPVTQQHYQQHWDKRDQQMGGGERSRFDRREQGRGVPAQAVPDRPSMQAPPVERPAGRLPPQQPVVPPPATPAAATPPAPAQPQHQAAPTATAPAAPSQPQPQAPRPAAPAAQVPPSQHQQVAPAAQAAPPQHQQADQPPQQAPPASSAQAPTQHQQVPQHQSQEQGRGHEKETTK